MRLRWLSIAAWPSLGLLMLMSLSGMAFVWNSFDLVHLGMENYRFLREQGVLAVMEGGLLQATVLVLQGLLSLACYLVFKTCEAELVNRWRARPR